ncbi:TlpA disulfide reductase family protein [Porticoccus sp. W117]|uniref:TlpA family protein disulfide reductase n=1 Tax=Porticoccus sp. W117 TaxID=3054777 RepID=UPI0025928358|nr:TlpA disulfide reductase family protein [Porticoccus sp. W117]MDM3870700.1 TlpA disulfide reductase family protein [Porticoccus sp. W117]
MKKLLATVLLALASTHTWAEEYKITIEFTPGVTNATEVELSINGETTKADIVDNRATFTGKIEDMAFAKLSTKSRYHNIILENAEYDIRWQPYGTTSTGGDLHNLIYGYFQNPEYIAATKAHHQVTLKRSNIDDMDREAMAAWMAELRAAGAPRNKIKNDYLHNILQGDYSALEKFLALKGNYDWNRYDLQKKLEMAQSYQKQLPENNDIAAYIESIKRGIARSKVRDNLAEGSIYKPVTAKTVDGEMLELESVLKENKLVLLEFWASWCGPCRGAFPHLKRVYDEYHDKGFEIYAISLDEDHDDWLQALEEEDAPWINLIDEDAFDAKSALDYAVTGIPASFLITSDGKMLGSDFRDWKLDDALKEFFDK